MKDINLGNSGSGIISQNMSNTKETYSRVDNPKPNSVSYQIQQINK
jgi:hypothetical protein